MRFIDITNDNKELAKELQAKIFPEEKSPMQIEDGIISKNPNNFICYIKDNIPVGIVGFYFDENLPEHVLLNWYGVLERERQKGYGKQILLDAITYCKKYYSNKLYLTYYTDKFENAAAVSLYNHIGFTTKDYCYEEDVKAMTEHGIKNTFVVGVFPLTDIKKSINFRQINMKIAKQYEVLDCFN